MRFNPLRVSTQNLEKPTFSLLFIKTTFKGFFTFFNKIPLKRTTPNNQTPIVGARDQLLPIGCPEQTIDGVDVSAISNRIKGFEQFKRDAVPYPNGFVAARCRKNRLSRMIRNVINRKPMRGLFRYTFVIVFDVPNLELRVASTTNQVTIIRAITQRKYRILMRVFDTRFDVKCLTINDVYISIACANRYFGTRRTSCQYA